MCGFAGSTKASRQTLEKMRDLMIHRGPDAQGIWQENDGETGVELTHTRLAIIDLSPGGAQPMESSCGRYVISFNGEIYNYRTLRAELEALGEQFRSESDTEVLLVLLRREGKRALAKLVGMFAFALWDKREKTMLLARDRLGIKPLVYAVLPGGQLAFASEIAALRAHPGIDLGMDNRALSEYLACLYVPAPMTIHRGIRKLAPGHLLIWNQGQMVVETYWRPHYYPTETISLNEAVEEVYPAVKRAVVDRMVADVEVGCFLSGGIDSSVIAAFMAEEAKAQGAKPINSFTMTFDEKMYDERDNAQIVANHIGSHHRELPAASSLVGLLDKYVAAFGEPFGNPTALLINDLSRKAREHVTVALVGDGGDEVFAGYPRYKGGVLAQRYRAKVPAFLREKVIYPLSRLIPESQSGRHSLRRAREFLEGANLDNAEMYAAWVEYFTPAERSSLISPDFVPPSPIVELYHKAPSQDPLDAMQQTDLLSFLPGNLLAYGDAMSMQHALELRVPLIDHRVIEAVGRISSSVRFDGSMKAILKGIGRKLLPSSIIDLRKKGFNPPMGVWLATDLRPMVHDRLTKVRMEELGLNWQAVDKVLDEHFQKGRDHSLKVWSLLVLDAWASSTDR